MSFLSWANFVGSADTEGEGVGYNTQKRTILKSQDSQKLSHLEDKYQNSRLGVDDGGGNAGIDLNGTDSLFNPFYIFRYAKYGSPDGKSYFPEYHKNIAESIQFVPSEGAPNNVSSPTTVRNRQKEVIENPSAATIIEFAANQGDQETNGTTLGPTPYQWNDFLWCKWYGKIPNNRLLTLRRYPIPVEDNLQISQKKMPLVPIAQAVTWWGEGTNNSLSNVIGMTYGFNWAPRTADVKDVAGNEVQVSQLLDQFGLTKGENGTLRQALLATFFVNPSNPFASTGGYDQKLQEWLKASYGSEGQYWNRVLGPVNVIDSTQIRERGYNFNHEITLNFSYQLRSFNNINPKIAMLDLISNFLSLTYNKAEFWGGASRYFQKTGYTLPGFPSEKFDQADFIGGIGDALKYIFTQVQQKQEQIKGVLDKINKSGLAEGKIDTFIETMKTSPELQNIAGAWVGKLLQIPLTMRSILDGRAVGEWHLTVGNPIEPFAVIGNLCLKSTEISFSETLGLDDVPNEINFKVTLMPGRPRAKQDIESMFNLGGGSMSYSPLSDPSSAYNSYGATTSQQLNEVNGADAANASREANAATGIQSTTSMQNSANSTASSNLTGNANAGPNRMQDAQNKSRFVQPSVRKAYGDKFAASPVLVDYFADLKLKD